MRRALGTLLIAIGITLLVVFGGLALVSPDVATKPDPGAPSLRVPESTAEAAPSPLPVVTDGKQQRARSARQGAVLATIEIPALGAEWRYDVIEGIREVDLARGMAHYPMTPLFGERGNVAIAGHRWDGPLYHFERLHRGDRITITQGALRWVYEIVTEPEIIQIDDVWVIDPVPGHGRDRMLTLTTCWPPNGSSHREYVRARLIERTTP